jgi:hypothetical protein
LVLVEKKSDGGIIVQTWVPPEQFLQQRRGRATSVQAGRLPGASLASMVVASMFTWPKSRMPEKKWITPGSLATFPTRKAFAKKERIPAGK